MSDRPIVLRATIKEDFPQLVELDHTLWNSALTPAEIRWADAEEYETRHPPGSQLVAVDGDTICGYIGFHQPTSLPSNGHVREIDIAVHPFYRRMGIGVRLIDAAKEKLSNEGVRKLSLRVLSTNESAISFYTRCGFIEQGRLVHEFELEGRYVDDILMYCMLR